MHASPQTRYDVFSAAAEEEVALLLGQAFSTREPIGIAVGFTAEEFAAFVRLQMQASQTQELTIVARRADTGEIVGALLANDGASSSGGERELGEKFAMVGSILGKLVETYGGVYPAPGEMLHLFLLGVCGREERMGIGQELVAACIANGVRKGYRRAAAECTSRVSQHIFRKLGFEDRGTISYAEHEFNGCRIFASVAEHGGPVRMEKTL
jgi:hypothetical protein